LYYIGSRTFKSKEGKTFNVVTLAEVDAATKQGNVGDFFIDDMPELCKTLKFGDLINCTLELSSLSGKARLLSIEKLVKAFPVS
jgi:hypothetical protein